MHPFTQRLIEQTQKAYERYVNPQEGYFDAVDTQAGLLPAIGFVVLAAQIRVVPHRAELWLLHLYRITCARLNCDAEDVPQQLKGEIICEMALWQIRAKLYVYDTVRSPNGGRISCDQWMRMGCFPDQALAGGDCEDFSVCILEFFRAWCGIDLVSPVLNILQRTLLKYTGCLAIGQLRTSKGFASHAYVILLDSRYLQSLYHRSKTNDKGAWSSTIEFQKALVLEGTCYTESTWRGLSTQNLDVLSTPNRELQLRIKSEHRLYKLQCGLLDVPEFASNVDRYERMIKFRMPSSVVEKEMKYGKIFSLLTADFVPHPTAKQLLSVHWMLSTERSEHLNVPRIGIDHSLVAYYNSEIHLHSAVELPEDRAAMLNQVLKDLPFSSFQQAPPYALPPSERKQNAAMVDRYDYSPGKLYSCLLPRCEQYESARLGVDTFFSLFACFCHINRAVMRWDNSENEGPIAV